MTHVGGLRLCAGSISHRSSLAVQAAPPHVPALGVIAGLSFSHGSDNAVLHPSLLTSLKLILRFPLLVFFYPCSGLLWVSLFQGQENSLYCRILIYSLQGESRGFK